MQNGDGVAKNAGEMATVSRLFSAPRGSFFPFGPRGTGKSTLLQQTFPAAVRVDSKPE